MSGRRVFGGLGWRHAAPPVAALLISVAGVASIAGPDAVAAWIVSVFPVVGLVLAVWLLPALVPLRQAPREGRYGLAAVAAVFVLNMLILSLPGVGPFAALDWNWQGKTLDLLWCVAVIVMLTSAQRKEIGWTWQVRPATLYPALISVLAIGVVAFVALGANPPGSATGTLTLERVLFDTTYPNLVEEIIFRGFMLTLLDRAFAPRWTIAGAKLGWGVVLTAWLFGLAHGIAPGAEGGFVFEPVWLAASFFAGLVFGWIRALTGSLWPAFLAHCAPEIGILLSLPGD